jgi:hypothetical protein
MKFEMKMTEKDKKLLVFLGVFVVVVCFSYWGIRPFVKDIIEINDQMADDEDIKQEYDLKLSELPLLQADNEKLEENIVAVRETYFSMMTSDEIDKYLTNMVLSYNLYSYDLSISMPNDLCTLEPYQYSNKALYGDTDKTEDDEDEDISLEDEEEAEDDDEDEDAVNTGIYTAQVTLKLGGAQEDLTRLVDDLSNTDQKLRISSYSYNTTQSVENGGDGSYTVIENRTLNITLEIYMCEE